MDCQTVRSLLIDFEKGQLRRRIAGLVGRHVCGCRRCHQALESFRAYSSLRA